MIYTPRFSEAEQEPNKWIITYKPEEDNKFRLTRIILQEILLWQGERCLSCLFQDGREVFLPWYGREHSSNRWEIIENIFFNPNSNYF